MPGASIVPDGLASCLPCLNLGRRYGDGQRTVYCCQPAEADASRPNLNKPFRYPNNYISTTNYTLISFVPLNLLRQFMKVSNVYFLLSMVVAFIPGVSPVFPVTTVLPLVVVVGVAMLRDAADDILRYRADRRANMRRVLRVDPAATGLTEAVESRAVRVGDLLVIHNREEVPADCVVICSSSKDGGCFVETSNLDGETNLKAKMSKLWIQQCCCGSIADKADVEQLGAQAAQIAPRLLATATVECDQPSTILSKWYGKLLVQGDGVWPLLVASGSQLPQRSGSAEGGGSGGDMYVDTLDLDYFLLRGCAVRNVEWVMACVMYTGIDTKMFLNLTKSPPKVGRLDKKLNALVIGILIGQQIIIALLSMGYVLFRRSPAGQSYFLWWFSNEYNSGLAWIMAYFTHFILLSVMMPISLFVSLEFCKAIQARFMEWDDEMSRVKPITSSEGLKEEARAKAKPKLWQRGRGREAKAPTRLLRRERMRARSSTLNEELSQIQCVFSDKTGTLTENEMRFAKAFTGGWCFDLLEDHMAILRFLQHKRMKSPLVPFPLQQNRQWASAPEAELEGETELQVAPAGLRHSRYIFGGVFEPTTDDGGVGETDWVGDTYHWSGKGLATEPVGNKVDLMHVRNFIRALAYCNTVVVNTVEPEVTSSTSPVEPSIEYFGSSTDEVALVTMASQNGARLVARTSNTITVDFRDLPTSRMADKPMTMPPPWNDSGASTRLAAGVLPPSDEEELLGFITPQISMASHDLATPWSTAETVELLALLPFTSERKMMSVILRERDGRIHMYTKGADSNVLSRIAAPAAGASVVTPQLDGVGANVEVEGPSLREKRKHLRIHVGPNVAGGGGDGGGGDGVGGPMVLDRVKAFLDQCSQEGLRTLVCAERYFTEVEYRAWSEIWQEATQDTSATRESRIHAAAQLAESNLTVVGCTAIEDRLQEHVPETIDFLLRCGIMVWVLTGDKRETAFNIAVTSKLLNPEKDFIAHVQLAEGGANPAESVVSSLCSIMQQVKIFKARGQKVSVIIDGQSLELVLDHAENLNAFRELAMLLDSAVCCRVTPMQKARVVLLFQRQGLTCLAVGDGANDVSMIQAARVGVGIIGLEGSQAERAADYAIPRFHHLRRLLVVHGRYSLFRNSQLIQYSFYKNLVYTFTQCYYSFYMGFSGKTLFDSWVIMLYNMVFTLLPPLVMGVFDYDVRASVLMASPGLYPELRSAVAVRMSRKSSLVWVTLALFHSWMIFYGVFLIMLQRDTLARDGWGAGQWSGGTTMMTVMLLVVTLQAACTFATWTWVHVFSVVFSIVIYIACIFVYSSLPLSLGVGTYFNVPKTTFGDVLPWLNIILWPLTALVITVAVLCLREEVLTTNTHRVRQEDYWDRKQLHKERARSRKRITADADRSHVTEKPIGTTAALGEPLLTRADSFEAMDMEGATPPFSPLAVMRDTSSFMRLLTLSDEETRSSQLLNPAVAGRSHTVSGTVGGPSLHHLVDEQDPLLVSPQISL